MRALMACLPGIALLTGCTTLECADGTFDNHGTCVGFDPNDKDPPVTTASPAGGRSREPIPNVVTLTTNEAARIYYTSDGNEPDPAAGPGETGPVSITGVKQGTTLKFFAIDRAGNREATQTSTFDSDTTPPATVTGLTLTLTGATANLTWVNPTDADYAGTIVARVGDAVDVAPTPGMMYTSSMMLSSSLQIVAAGKSTSFSDPTRPAGPVRYVAWTYDDLGNYSLPVVAQANIPLGSLTAQLSWANNTLTRVSVPANLDITNTSAAINGTTLTVTLSVKNNSNQFFQNMKAEVTSTTGATFSNSDGTADGSAFRALGPDFVAPGATVTKILTFTGVGATATINLAFASHASLLGAGRSIQNLQLMDLGATIFTPAITTTSRGPNDRVNGRVRPPVLVGGRYLDVPTSHGTIERWDMVTRTKKASLKISEDVERVNVEGLYATPTTTFAFVKYGGRRRVAAAEIVRIDEGLNITGRLKMPTSADRGYAHPAFSADYSQMAVPLQGGIALVDTAKLTLIDASPGTQFSVDMIDPQFTQGIRAVGFFDGSNGLVAISRFGGQAAIIRRAGDDYTVTPYQDASTSTRGFDVATMTDGKVWLAFQSGIRAFDPTSGNITNIAYPNANPNGIAMVDGVMYVIRDTRATIDQVNATGGITKTIALPVNTTAHGHWLTVAK